MTTYAATFGGATIYTTDLDYQAVALSAETTFSWPEETSASSNLVARIMDVTPSAGSLSATMPDATKGSIGYSILLTNQGAYSYTVNDNDGVAICTVGVGEAWQIYLKTNSTAAGTWGSFQYASYVSQANASSLAGTGLTTSAAKLVPNEPVTTFSINATGATSDRARAYVWVGTAGTYTLPDPVVVGNGWYVDLQNSGSGSLTLDPGAALINGAASKVLDVLDSTRVITDGTDFYCIGFGQDAVFAFDNVSINVAGTGTYTLSGSELNRISYNFTGLLTGDRVIEVPSTVQQYWVRNSTTGSYSLTVKVGGMTGVIVTQGGAKILYCDGTDVTSADTGGIAVPVAVTEGGTGATTAGDALINLGGGAVGIAVFQSVTGNDAYSALGVAPSGVVDGGTF